LKRFAFKMIFLLPIPIVMVAVNVIGDPANLFRSEDYEVEIARIMLSGRNVANLTDYNERRVQACFAERLVERRDVLVLGSSRSMQVSSDTFPSRTFYNAGLSGATLEDHVGLLELYVEGDKAPGVLVWGLDPWLLNRANGQTRWMDLAGPCKRALVRLGRPVPPDVENAAAGAAAWEKYAQLLSPSYFQLSLKSIFNRLRRGGGGRLLRNR
jgi:hypothetical protein